MNTFPTFEVVFDKPEHKVALEMAMGASLAKVPLCVEFDIIDVRNYQTPAGTWTAVCRPRGQPKVVGA